MCGGGGGRETWFDDSVAYTQQSLGVLPCEEEHPLPLFEAMKRCDLWAVRSAVPGCATKS